MASTKMRILLFLLLIASCLVAKAQHVTATHVSAATRLTVPATTSQAASSTGVLAIDTDTDNVNITQSSISYYDGTRLMYVLGTDALPSVNNYVLSYDSAAKKLVWEAQSGAGVGDGDYGNITVTGGGTTWTIDAGVVALSQMANLAQDQFIGRVTASTGVPETTTITAAARTVLDDTTTSAMRTTIGLAIGTDVQAFDADLSAIAGLTSAADKGIQFTGSGTAGVFDLTAAGKALLDDADATAQRTTLGLGTVATESTVPIAKGGTGQTTAKAAYDALNGAEATVASATTTDLGAASSDKVSITGTTTITGFGTVAAGTKREGRFTGVLTLTHNATSLIVPGAANITTAAGDRFQAYSLGSGNWVVTVYTKADGTAVVGGGGVSDGDKGDITVSGSGATWTVDNDAVSNAKMANMAASTIKARVTGSTGDPEDATLSQVLDLVGSAANGDMLHRTGGSWARLAAPTQLSGSTLYYGPSGVEWVNGDTHYIYRNDFNIIASTAPGDFSNLSSSGSVAYMDPGANGIGGMNMNTGTTSTGYRHQLLGTGGSFAFGFGRTVVSWRCKVPNLSDGTDTYTMMVGAYDAVPSPVDGVWFQYTHSVNTGKFECKVADNSATTTTDSTITAAANTWYTFSIDVNAAATEAKFYINGTLVHTESGANIPQTGRVTSIATAGITKSAGTTARILSADYLDIYVKY